MASWARLTWLAWLFLAWLTLEKPTALLSAGCMGVMRSTTTPALGGLVICGRIGFSLAHWEPAICGQPWLMWNGIRCVPEWLSVPANIGGRARRRTWWGRMSTKF